MKFQVFSAFSIHYKKSLEPRKNREPKKEGFEGDVREDFIKLTWEEIHGVTFSITYMTWGRETRSKNSKRMNIWTSKNLFLFWGRRVGSMGGAIFNYFFAWPLRVSKGIG